MWCKGVLNFYCGASVLNFLKLSQPFIIYYVDIDKQPPTHQQHQSYVDNALVNNINLVFVSKPKRVHCR